MVALLNGLGGGASALVSVVEIWISTMKWLDSTNSAANSGLIVGGLTFSGSMAAAMLRQAHDPEACAPSKP